MTIKEGLQKALKLFDDGRNWVNHPPHTPGTYCAVIACSHIWPHNYVILVNALYPFIPKPRTAANWNDNSTWSEVKTVFEKAIAAAE